MSSIIGDGDIANALKDSVKKDFLFFCSGVSDSSCTDEKEYQREIDLLLDQPRATHIVYFSSLGVLDGNSRYYRHKRDMEVMIKTNFPKNTIIRLGNISAGDNPHTLINFLKNQINRGIKPEVKDVYRYIIDVDELLFWIDKIPSWTCEMNITGRRMKVQEIVDEIKAGKL